MKNPFLLIGCLLLTAFQSAGQKSIGDFDLNWGRIQEEKYVVAESVIGSDDNFFYAHRSSKNKKTYGLYVKYSKDDFREVWTAEVPEFEYHEKDAKLINSSVINGQIHLLFNVYHGSEDKRYLLSLVLDENGDAGDLVLVEEMIAEKKGDGGYSFGKSKDGSKLVIFSELPNKKKENEYFAVRVLDSAYNSLWSAEVELPYEDRNFARQNFKVTNGGEVFIHGIKTPERSKGEKKERKESNETHLLYKVFNEGGSVEEVNLGLEDVFVRDLGFYVDFGDQNTLAITGFYGEKKANEMSGSFFITLDQTSLEAQTSNMQPFDRDLVASVIGEKKAKKGKDIKGSWVFRDFIRREDGGVIVVAEQHSIVVVTTQTKNGTVTTYHYYYTDMLVQNIAPDGTIDWTAHIPKDQHTIDDGGRFSGYLLMVNGDRLHFLYNDHVKNQKLFGMGKKKMKTFTNKSAKKGQLVAVTLDGEGNMTYEVLMPTRDQDKMYFTPRFSDQSTGEKKNAVVRAIKPGFFKGKSRYGILTLETGSAEKGVKKKRPASRKPTPRKKSNAKPRSRR